MFLRFEGQDSSLEIDYRSGDNVLASFRKKYESIFGHWISREVEVESIKVIASVEPAVEKIRPSTVNVHRPRVKKSSRYKPVENERMVKFTNGRISARARPFPDLRWLSAGTPLRSLKNIGNGHLTP